MSSHHRRRPIHGQSPRCCRSRPTWSLVATPYGSSPVPASPRWSPPPEPPTSRSRPTRTSTTATSWLVSPSARVCRRWPRSPSTSSTFRPPGRGSVRAVQQLLAAAPVDAVIVDPLFLAGALLAELPRPAPRGPGLPLPSQRDLAPFGLGAPPLSGLPGRLRNGLMRAVNARVLRNAEAAGTAIMQRTHGRDGSGPIMDWLTRADAVVQLTVPAFEYPRPDAATRLDSPAWSPPLGAGAPRPAWWADLDGPRPVVHVTQGTIANHDLSK